MVRYWDTTKRKVGDDGRIGYTWRLTPDEADKLDSMVEKGGYSDRTAWFREKVLGLPALVRSTKPKKSAKKPAKKAKAKSKKPVRKSKADIGEPAVEEAEDEEKEEAEE